MGPRLAARFSSFLCACSVLWLSPVLSTPDRTFQEIARTALLVNDQITCDVDLKGKVVTVALRYSISSTDPAPMSAVLIDQYRVHQAGQGVPRISTPLILQIDATGKMSRPLHTDFIDETHSYLVHLKDPLLPNMKTVISVKYFVGHALSPLPATLPMQGVLQKVVFKADEFVLSPYPTTEQVSKFHLAGRLLRSVPHNPAVGKTEAQFGPYFNTTANNRGDQVLLHFVMDANLGHFTEVIRTVKLSHYGNVFVHEEYYYSNEAAGIEGEFDRTVVGDAVGQIFGSLRRPNFVHTPSRMTLSLDAYLPPHAFGLEYYDKIGNVSRSHARQDPSYVFLTVEPRFPVLGQWNSDWQLEYSLPLRSVLNILKKTNTHVLSLPFYPPFRNIFVDTFTLRVILPSGSSNFKVYTPHVVASQSLGLHWNWLDVLLPSNVIELTAHNVFAPAQEAHRKMQILYNYSETLFSLLKPLICVALSFIPFVIYLIVKHCNVAIETVAERKEREKRSWCSPVAAQLWDMVAEAVDTNWIFVNSIEDLIVQKLTSGETNNEAIENLKAEQTSEVVHVNSTIHELCSRCDNFNSIFPKLDELQRAVDECITYITSVGQKSTQGHRNSFTSQSHAYKEKISKAELSLIDTIKACQATCQAPA